MKISQRLYFILSLKHVRRGMLVWLMLLVPSLVMGQAPAPDIPKASDVRIVIDISGSMKKNDPQNLRRPALDMLVKLLPEGSQAGVWTFGQYVNMLVKHRAVDDAWRQEALSKAQEINSIAQFTNIGQALENAAYDKDYSTRGDYQTHVILLTDGMVDIDRDPAINTQERNRILQAVLPGYQQADYTVHTISLSENADKNLMDRLAIATNGQSVVAKNADELMAVFLQVFDQAVPKEELPFDGNSFLTDSSIEEFTALIFPQPGSMPVELIAPDQAVLTATTVDPTVSWYHTDQYDLITVKQPLEGEWRVKADLQPQSRITVVSDLSLVVKPIPVNLQLNQQVDLSLALREENKVVNRAEFLQLLDIDTTVKKLNSDQQWQQRLSEGLVPGNGVYQTTFDHFASPGDYEVLVNVDGKSFQRQFSHRLTVREPFAINSETLNQNGKTLFKITVIPQDTKINLQETQVVGKLKTPEGVSSIHPFSFNDQQQWEHIITPEAEGIYYLSLRITAVNDKGQSSDVMPEPMVFQYPEVDSLFTQALPQPEPEPEPMIEPPKEDIVIVEPKEAEPTTVPIEEIDLSGDDDETSNMAQWLLYGVLGIVNILIILVIYFLYRKLFGSSREADDEDDGETETVAKGVPPIPESFDDLQMDSLDEPPMNEMSVEELDTELEDALEESEFQEDVSSIDVSESDQGADIDLADEAPFDLDDDPLADLGPEALDDVDDSAVEDEEPEFSLDDFAPDTLDDDDLVGEDKNTDKKKE